MEEKFVISHWNVTRELKNGWLLSLGYGKLDDNNNHEYYENNYITEEQLKNSLDYMTEIINTIGVPQIGSCFYDDYSISKIYEVEYKCYSKNLHINLIE